ncbi:hypothetical protein DNTS_004427 [Danionella cerebrum]|uniref:Uncharacterized protein n=1 Tax=Danionella cerebrum TaxID=2873325 RepID=A0A553PZ78_9TELE|nr:hypothetical protein DNTS_004427 [Danionella translucida]
MDDFEPGLGIVQILRSAHADPVHPDVCLPGHLCNPHDEAPVPGSFRTQLGASPPPPEATFEDVPEGQSPTPLTRARSQAAECSLLPQEVPLIPSDPEPESSQRYHPSHLELEDLAFGE